MGSRDVAWGFFGQCIGRTVNSAVSLTIGNEGGKFYATRANPDVARGPMKPALALITIGTLAMLLWSPAALALDPSLDVSQYGHTSWTARDGFSLGAIFAMAQTPDGYLWLASEFGLYRFDGIKPVAWQPPTGQLPHKAYSLLVTRDGTLWIGTFEGLVSWDGKRLTGYPEIGRVFVTSLLEDREGTVWAGMFKGATSPARLCAIRGSNVQCHGKGEFGTFVWSVGEDGTGAIWAGAESGYWQWKPGPPKRYAIASDSRVGDMVLSDNGSMIFGISRAGLKQASAGKLRSFPVYSATNRNVLLPDREVDSNKLLRDRDGGLWIGTNERGLIHTHNGRTDVFAKADGLSGNISCSQFEDREGNIWFASTRGLDRFRELPAVTFSANQGLSSNYATSLVSGNDGSVWIGSHDGLTRWKNGQPKVFRKSDGLPGDSVQSMFEDNHGRLWATFAGHGLSYFKDGRFVSVPGIPSDEVYSIGGDDKDNIWLSGNKGLSHVRDGRVLETFPWSAMGRQQQAKVVIPDEGGVWLAFWIDGGVQYFKDGQVRASYTTKDGLGKGPVGGFRRDRDGVLWASIQEGGGLSRIKDGKVITLTSKNGLPCDTIHWSIEDDDRSVWLYTSCGLVRITKSELDAGIADPNHRIETTVWDPADGVPLTQTSPAYFNPPVAKAGDGKLWFLGVEGVAVVDPHHPAFNKVPPPVHIEQIVADNKVQWQNSQVPAASNLRLPPRIRDLTIDYNALTFAATEKVHFKYKLEGQDPDWKEVINDRQAKYTNLAPRSYRFRVIASNNSGVWNEQGDTLEFSIAAAYYQTNWFRALCTLAFLASLLGIYAYRVRQLHHEFEMTLDARVDERTRIARELHDTLLQSAHGMLLRFQIVSQLLPGRPAEAKEKLDTAIDQTAEFITEARDQVQGLRASTLQTNDLAQAIRTLGEELTTDATSHRPAFRVAVEGESRNLHPILRDEICKVAAEALRNAFRHAQARQIEVEIRYDHEQFRMRVRDDGRGIDPAILSRQRTEGHYGLPGMRERAALIGGKLVVWSQVDAGTEVELRVPASKAYATPRRSWFSRKAKA